MSEPSSNRGRPRRRLFVEASVLVALLAVLGGVFTWIATSPGPEPIVDVSSRAPREVTGRNVFQSELQLISGVRAPITEVPVTLADLDQTVRPDELVIGVAIGDAARAYPLNMINGPDREVINDSLGGRPIVVTWCPYCHHAVVFGREVEGRVLVFGLEGSMWKDNLVMYDEATHSLWSQMLGRAMSGPLEGRELTPVAAVVTEWERWRARHPRCGVLQLRRSFGELRRGYYNDLSLYVLGIAEAQHARAWPLNTLAERPVLDTEWRGRPVLLTFDRVSATARLFERSVAGRILNFQDRDSTLIDVETGTTWDALTGAAKSGPLGGARLTALPAVIAFRSSWLAFHPESEIIEPAGGGPAPVGAKPEGPDRK